jgi:hypothetical protein
MGNDRRVTVLVGHMKERLARRSLITVLRLRQAMNGPSLVLNRARGPMRSLIP